MYTIKFDQCVFKELDKIGKYDLKGIKKKIWSLKQNPRPRGSKKLKGLSGLYLLRVGNYRIVYTIEDDILTILIVHVRHRRDVYR
jgi:mRNA interferase RelE/StbE